MDIYTEDRFNELSLCTGYHGIGLGLSLVEPKHRTIVMVEREAFAIANLASKMEAGLLDPCFIWDDLQQFNGKPWRGIVDVLSVGFSCQPWSQAGQKKGTEDERWIWPDIARIVREVNPKYVFVENVPGLICGGLGYVYNDLTEIGYCVTHDCFYASDLGAPHQRERIFVLAQRLEDSAGIGRGRGSDGKQTGVRWSLQTQGSSELGDSEEQSIGTGLCEGGAARKRRGRLGNSDGETGEEELGDSAGVRCGGRGTGQRDPESSEPEGRQGASGRSSDRSGNQDTGEEEGTGVSDPDIRRSQEPGTEQQADGSGQHLQEGAGTGVSHAGRKGLQGGEWTVTSEEGWAGTHGATPELSEIWPARPGKSQYWWEPPRVTTGKDKPDVVRSGESWGDYLRRYRDKLFKRYMADPERNGAGGEPGHGGCPEEASCGGREEGAGVGEVGDGGSETGEPCGRGSDTGSPAQSSLVRNFDGITAGMGMSNRHDELRLIGNGVVPMVAGFAWCVLKKRLAEFIESGKAYGRAG